jgi:hypothetical protein
VLYQVKVVVVALTPTHAGTAGMNVCDINTVVAGYHVEIITYPTTVVCQTGIQIIVLY